MLKKRDFEYCELNESSKGIFPTYFLLDLKLTEEQKGYIQKLIDFLQHVADIHTPLKSPKCDHCDQFLPIMFADTWWSEEHKWIQQDIRTLKRLLEPNSWAGDHT